MTRSTSIRRLTAVFVCALGLTVLSACSSSDDPAEEAEEAEEIVFGALYDGSGGSVFYSLQSIRAIELAVAEINRQGGILGRQVRLIRQDDGGDPTVASLRMQSLIEGGAVATFLTSGSASTLQAKAVLSQEQVPGITPSNVNAAVTQPPNDDYMFSIANTASQLATFIAEYMNAQNYERFAIFTDTSPTGSALEEQYRGALTAAGLSHVATEAIDVGATDASSAIARIRDSQPDVVFISGQGAPEQALFVRQAAQQGFDVPMVQDTTGALPDYWRLAGPEALENVVTIDTVDESNPLTLELRAIFEREHPGEPFLGLTAWGWDIVHMYAAAITSANSIDGTAIRDAMDDIDAYQTHFGPAGHTISCTASRLCATTSSLVLRSFRDGVPADVVFPVSDG